MVAEDLGPLRSYWHPVAYSDELEARPVSVTVLEEPIVVFRDASGGTQAFRDLCPHRGAKLSLGRMRDGGLVCPYHGFEYDSEGRCRVIPSQPPDRQVIPSRLRLKRYGATERYGIVWIALEEPRQPVPAFPEYEEEGFYTHASRLEIWNTSAARWMENFLDITHFAHVHPGILGDPAEPVCEPYDVHQTETGLRYEYDTPYQPDPSRWPNDPERDPTDLELSHFRVELSMPFTVSYAVESDDGTWTTLITGLPVTATQVKFFTVHARNYLLDLPDEQTDVLAHAIAEQDRPIAESQRPEMLPCDFTEEVHLRVGDAIGVAYRRRLRELGLTYA